MALRWLVRVALTSAALLVRHGLNPSATWTSVTLQMKEVAEHVRRFGNEMYPKILGLLVEDPSKVPARFDVIFKEHGRRVRRGMLLRRYPVP